MNKDLAHTVTMTDFFWFQSKGSVDVLPFAVFGTLALLCGFLMLCLPETNKQPLKDHIMTVPESDSKVKVNGVAQEEVPLQGLESWYTFCNFIVSKFQMIWISNSPTWHKYVFLENFMFCQWDPFVQQYTVKVSL